MLTVEQALDAILLRARSRPPCMVPLAVCPGLVLAEEVASDVDSPPHDKALVDGYAVMSSDLADGVARLTVLEEVVAGDVPTLQVEPGTATRIMTGAPLPDGADAVVMVEHTRPPDDGHGMLEQVLVECQAQPGQNIMRRATSLARGQVVLRSGQLIRPVEVGLLCEVGRTSVSVVPRVQVAVLPTGNELVPADQCPGPGQIRNSNGPMLLAAAARAGAEPLDLGIARDERPDLEHRVARGFAADVLVLSGGVSAGVLDLVPGVLAGFGVEEVFHKVRLKPGKPLWFGVLRHEVGEKLVFGLPGNPVSSLVCFELFVRPAVESLMGRTAGPRYLPARLASQFEHRGDRPTYFPARLERDSGGASTLEPLAWHGSADLRGLAEANALACFAAGDRTYEAGDPVLALPLE